MMDFGAMLGQSPLTGHAYGAAGMVNANIEQKPRLAEVLSQTGGALGELEKILIEILTRLQGPTPTKADKVPTAAIINGSVSSAVAVRSDVLRLQGIAQSILNEL